jgi:hypothetical protein
MKHKAMKAFFHDLVQKPEKFSNINDMAEQSIDVFDSMMEAMTNAKPEELEEFKKAMQELQGEVETKLSEICEMANISRNELNEVLSNPSYYSEEDWKSIEQFKAQLATKQKELGFDVEEKLIKTQKKKRIKKTKKSWLTA